MSYAQFRATSVSKLTAVPHPLWVSPFKLVTYRTYRNLFVVSLTVRN